MFRIQITTSINHRIHRKISWIIFFKVFLAKNKLIRTFAPKQITQVQFLAVFLLKRGNTCINIVITKVITAGITCRYLHISKHTLQKFVISNLVDWTKWNQLERSIVLNNCHSKYLNRHSTGVLLYRNT